MATVGSQHVRHLGRHLGFFKKVIFSKKTANFLEIEYRDVTVLESLKHVSMGMERRGFLFSVMSSPIVYFLTTLLALCPNINPTILCAHVCDVNYAACYFCSLA